MASVGAGIVATSAWAIPADSHALALAALERRSGGRLSVFAADLATGRTLAYRADERFRLQSSFEALLSAMLLHQAAAGGVRLDEAIRYSITDLLDASPVTTANVAAGTMTIGASCAAIMAYSDNAGANLLLRRFGGPAALTAFLRSIGDSTTRLDNREPRLSAAPYPADSTTPRAIVATLGRFLSGATLLDAERRHGRCGWRATRLAVGGCARRFHATGMPAIAPELLTASATTLPSLVAPAVLRC